MVTTTVVAILLRLNLSCWMTTAGRRPAGAEPRAGRKFADDVALLDHRSRAPGWPDAVVGRGGAFSLSKSGSDMSSSMRRVISRTLRALAILVGISADEAAARDSALPCGMINLGQCAPGTEMANLVAGITPPTVFYRFEYRQLAPVLRRTSGA